jgi:hypothetical protein
MKTYEQYDNIPLNSARNGKVSDKVVEKIKSHILCSITFP